MVKTKKPTLTAKGFLKELKPGERIIRSLIEIGPQSILSLANSAGVDYKNTYNLLEKLENIISRKKIGNTVLVTLQPVPNIEIYKAEMKRTEEFLARHPKLKIVKKYVEEMNYPFFTLLVFGSYAKGIESEKSDIDLCIISDNLKKSKELQDRLEILSLRLELHSFTTAEFTSMIEKKQGNLGLEIIKSNFILYGIENYYNLVSKWTKKE